MTAAPFFPTTARRSSIAPSSRKRREEIADYKDLLSRRPDSSRQSGNLGDGRRRQQQAPGDAQRRGEFRARTFFPGGKRIIFASNMANPERPQRLRSLHHQRRRHRPRADHLLTPTSTPSRCLPPTASASSGPPIATARRRTKPTSSSPIGWSEAVVGCQLSVVSFATRVPRSNVVLAKAGPFNEVR